MAVSIEAAARERTLASLSIRRPCRAFQSATGRATSVLVQPLEETGVDPTPAWGGSGEVGEDGIEEESETCIDIHSSDRTEPMSSAAIRRCVVILLDASLTRNLRKCALSIKGITVIHALRVATVGSRAVAFSNPREEANFCKIPINGTKVCFGFG